VSDPTRTLVTPLEPVVRVATRKGFGRLCAVVRELGPEIVVVGLPLSLSGADSAQTREARAFAARLEAALAGPEVVLYDERFTTALAKRRPGEAAEDSRAAAVLLEEWLQVRTGSGPDT
jgi:putative Holliday junction resolvase